MKPIIFLFLLFISNPLFVFSQGINNDFEYDETDIKVITQALGFYTFKFPVSQTGKHLYDIVIEEFENGKMITNHSLINDTKQKFLKHGVNATNYFYPSKNKDSVYFHRFYFHKQDTLMSLKIKSHGIESKYDFNFNRKSTYNLSAFYSAKSEIDSLGYMNVEQNKPLMFLYANSEKTKEQPLWCPSGITKDNLISKFYYVIFISIQEYIED